MKLTFFFLLCVTYAFGQEHPTRMNLQTEKLSGNVASVDESVYKTDPKDTTRVIPTEDREFLYPFNRKLEFDRSGNLVHVETGGPVYRTETTYRFYKNGLLKELSRTQPEDVDFVYTETYFYNDVGQLQRLVAGGTDGDFKETTYAYDGFGRVISEKDRGLSPEYDSSSVFKKTFTTAANKELTVEVFVHEANKEPYRHSTAVYDTLGHRIRELLYFPNGTPVYCLEHCYDAQGNATRTDYCGEEGKPRTLKTYDANGLLLTEQPALSQARSNHSTSRFERVFDDQGNWTIERCYTENALNYEIRRSIRYYP